MSGRFILGMITAAVFLSSLCGCSGSAAAKGADNGGINVVASIFPAYDFARAVTGGRANVSMLISPGSSIHSFDPSPADIKKINEADVFIYVGGESDKWVERVLSSVDVTDKRLVRFMDVVTPVKEEAAEGIEPEGGEAHDGHVYDEHVWTSPQNAAVIVSAISDALAAADPDNADFYRENSRDCVSEINEVGDEIRDIVENAKRNRIVVADRFPFRYFVDEYGLSYAAAFGACSDQTDASVATIAYLVKTVNDESIPYIYHAELSTENVARLVGEQTGAGLLLLHSCQNVSKDEFDAGETYVSIMRKNAENLKKGLN